MIKLVKADTLRLPGVGDQAGQMEDGDMLVIGGNDWTIMTTNPELKRHLEQVTLKLSNAGGPSPLYANIMDGAKRDVDESLHERHEEEDLQGESMEDGDHAAMEDADAMQNAMGDSDEIVEHAEQKIEHEADGLSEVEKAEMEAGEQAAETTGDDAAFDAGDVVGYYRAPDGTIHTANAKGGETADAARTRVASEHPDWEFLGLEPPVEE